MKEGRKKGILPGVQWRELFLPWEAPQPGQLPSDFKEMEAVWGEESSASSCCPQCVSALHEMLRLV